MPMMRRDVAHPLVRELLEGLLLRFVDPSLAKSSLLGVVRRGNSQADEWSSMAALLRDLSIEWRLFMVDIH